jgi:hypothetical protein
MQSVEPDSWACVAKAYQNHPPSTSDAGLSRWGNAAYVGDLTSDYDGLKTAVTRMLAKASEVPAPVAELTGYDYLQNAIPSEVVYFRRLSSALSGQVLTLAAEPSLSTQPLLYRIARWPLRPSAVGLDGARVTVNAGGSLPEAASETAVNGSRTSAWYYDQAASRLIVKVVP